MMDAPYIREAESVGMPSNDLDLRTAIKELREVDKMLDNSVDSILNAEDELEKVGYKLNLRDLLYSIEDLGCDVRKLMNQLIKASA